MKSQNVFRAVGEMKNLKLKDGEQATKILVVPSEMKISYLRQALFFRLRDPFVYICVCASLFIFVLLAPRFFGEISFLWSVVYALLVIPVWGAFYILSVVYADFHMRHLSAVARGYVVLILGCAICTPWTMYWHWHATGVPSTILDYFLVFLGIYALAIFTRSSELSSFKIAVENPSVPDIPFLKRMRLLGHQPLVRIEAQDHYLKVVTEGQSDFIRMRLSDAVKELEEYPGMQVHRSHWVASEMIEKMFKSGQVISLLLADGSVVPVSAPNKEKVLNWFKENK